MEPKQYAAQLMGEYIKRKRLEFNYFQERLGVEIGYNVSSAKQAISQLERGVTWIPKQKIGRLAKVLNIPEKWLTQLDFMMQMRQYDSLIQQLESQLKQEYGIEPLSASLQANTQQHTGFSHPGITPNSGVPNYHPYTTGVPIYVSPPSGVPTHTIPPVAPAEPEPPKEVQASITADEFEQRMQKMKEFLERGLITADEFEEGRKRLLQAWLP